MKKGETGGHVARRGEMKSGCIILVENHYHVGYFCADGRLILKCSFKEIEREFVEWVHLAEGKIQRQTLVNMVMNL
jgi:hypothetical protein